jgi:shikimate kinase
MAKIHHSLCFIGMSGIGKSSFGSYLAKKFNRPFIDTDDIIEKKLSSSIKAYIEKTSESDFLIQEEAIILAMTIPKNSIIATGGSVVYSEKAMTYLKKQCTLVYLNDSLENIKNRISNYDTRGVIMNNNKTLDAVYNERKPLYEKWQDITIIYPSPFSANSIISAIESKIIGISNHEL